VTNHFDEGDNVVLENNPSRVGTVLFPWATSRGLRYFVHFPEDKEGEETSYDANDLELF
jgi:hypothetical protein